MEDKIEELENKLERMEKKIVVLENKVEEGIKDRCFENKRSDWENKK
ncbi:hypothetical protein [Mesobacillus foraminis]|nr:hypothetical protein [Mesobacillus foraminis]